MKRGKHTCRILKEIRQQIARENNIEFITSECQYQGDCMGTCPKCESEVRYLEQQLEHKRLTGKAITVLGISTGVMALTPLASCTGTPSKDTTASKVVCDTTADTQQLLFGEAAPEKELAPPDSVHTPTRAKTSQEIPANPKKDSVYTLLGDRQPIVQGMVPPRKLELVGEVESSEDVILGVRDPMPEFPGGTDSLIRFVRQNLRHPEVAGEDIEGRVIVKFIIQKDGSVTDAEVAKSLHPLFDEEALRVVRSMPKWKPGTRQGEPVSGKYILPVLFKKEIKGSSSRPETK